MHSNVSMKVKGNNDDDDDDIYLYGAAACQLFIKRICYVMLCYVML